MGIATTTTKAQTNLNDYIYVKLTEEGYNILVENERSTWICAKHPEYARDIDAIKATVDENGYKAFQMWDFVNIFGKHLKWGSNPLDLNVLIDVKTPVDTQRIEELEWEIAVLEKQLLHQLELKEKEVEEFKATILERDIEIERRAHVANHNAHLCEIVKAEAELLKAIIEQMENDQLTRLEHEISKRDKEIAMLQANITNISKP